LSSQTHPHAHDPARDYERVDPHEPDYRDPPLRALPVTFWTLARFPLLALIRLYQMTVSRALPPNTCRFYPTCSHYGYQAIYKYGVLKGGWLATWRVLRCNPFNPGGLDPVP
jgi:putative membrane protein insertion efficiency factor